MYSIVARLVCSVRLIEPREWSVLQLLELNPHQPSLRMHRLHGTLRALHSVSINRSHRVTLELVIQGRQIISQ